MTDGKPLELEEQIVIQSTVIRAAYNAIISSGMNEPGWKYDVDTVKLLNLLNMAQKELTNMQRTMMMHGKRKKTRTVNDLTEQSATSPPNAPK